MDELKKILQDKFPQIDFDNEENLVDDGVLDSVAVLGIIAEIEDKFDISVTMEYIQPQYFNSLSAMWELIEEPQESAETQTPDVHTVGRFFLSMQE